MRSVVIVGAGLAGLTAAYELQSRGYSTRILEADNSHIGGRARTIRFSQSAYAEAGAMRIPAHHNLTREYVRHFGLSLRPFIQDNPRAFSRIRNDISRSGDSVDYTKIFDLASSHREESPIKIWSSTVGRLVESLTDEEKLDVFRDRPETSKIRSLDTFSLLGWLMNEGMSHEAIQMLASAWSLESSLHSSLTVHVRTQIDGTWINSFDEISGGTDLLPKAIAGRLDNSVMQGCKVTKITQFTGGVQLDYEQHGKCESLIADFAVCTAPLGPTRRIDFEPPLAPRKREAMRRVNYDSATKVIGHTSRRFWEIDDNIFGGGSSDDDVLGSTWYPNDNTEQADEISNRPSAFTASYSWGQQAKRNANNAEKIKKALSELHAGLIKRPDDLLRLTPWAWHQFTLSEGAYAHFLPGEHTSLHFELSKPEGRIYFAGEHTTLEHAWMQGAIASGKKAADAIDAA